MAEIKRVSDSYTISAPVIVFDGNVQINGSNTVVDTITTVITDNTITLNSGETGAGVSTLGTTAQIVVDRGSLPDVVLRWNETTDTWQLTSDGSTYLDIITGSGTVSAAGSPGQIQYNSAGVLGAEADFNYDDSANYLYVGNVQIGNGSVTNVGTNGNLSLSANGTGTINMSSVAVMDFQGSTPGSTASKTKIYAATPGEGTSGVYFVNTVDSGEIASKKRAIAFGLIMR
jgi:hypothetical protein